MIRRAVTDADLAGWCEVWNAITPREPTALEYVKRRIARHPERLYLVAEEEDGRIVGAGFAGDSDSPGRAALAVRVLPGSRRRGIGSALYEPAVNWARDQGSEWISGMVAEHDVASRAWVERHGFAEYGRQVELVLELRGDERGPTAPVGIEIAEVSDALRAPAYVLAQEAWRDLPTPTPMEAPPYEEWLEEDLPGPVAFAALDDGELVGFASLVDRAAPGLLEHGLTATRRTHRRRGIATALKQTEIAWAAANGYRELITFTQDKNEGMQAINLELGFLPLPAWISVRRRP